MNDIVIVIKEGQKKPKQVILSGFDKDGTFLAEVLRAYTETNLSSKYGWVIRYWNIDVAQELKLVGIKKY